MPKNNKEKKDENFKDQKKENKNEPGAAIEFSINKDGELAREPSDAEVEEFLELARNKKHESGIYNYCDRWCEKCADIDKCFLYAQEKHRAAARGSGGEENMEDIIGEVEYNFKMARKIMSKIANEEKFDLDLFDGAIPDSGEEEKEERKFEKTECLLLTRDYFAAVSDFLRDYYEAREQYRNELQLEMSEDDIKDEIDAISWYHSMLPSKVWRLLYERLEIDKEEDAELKQMIKEGFEKFLVLVEKMFEQSRQAISGLAKKRTEYRETAARLLVKLNLAEQSYREEFGQNPKYGAFTGKFSPEQIEAMRAYADNQEAGIDMAFEYFLDKPDDHSNYGVLGDMHINAGKFKEAARYLEAGARFNPREALLFFLWGVALSKAGRFNEGLRRLKQAEKIDPKEIEIKRNIGWVTAMRGRYKSDQDEIEKGREILKKIIKEDKNNILAMTDLGQSYLMAHDFESAFEWTRRAREIEPENEFVNMIYNDVVEMRRQYQEDPGFKDHISKQRVVKAYSGPEPKDDREMDDILAKQFEIEETINELNQGNLSQEEAARVMKKLEKSGLIGQVTAVTDPNSPKARVAGEYIAFHQKVRGVENKISLKETKEIGKKLSRPKTSNDERKKLILILAHQGTESALKILEQNSQNAKGDIKTWFKMAIQECRAFLDSGDQGPGMFFNKI